MSPLTKITHIMPMSGLPVGCSPETRLAIAVFAAA